MSDLFPITLLSLQVSTLATLISLLIGLPLGTMLALGKFPGRAFVMSLINTGMALPPVVVGLFVAMSLWRSGPLGDLKLIYTPAAIIIAQTIIAAPVVTGLTAAALQQLNPRLRLQLYGLGASRAQMIFALWREVAGRTDGGLRLGHLGGRRIHDGGWQHQGTDARADHGHRARDWQGRVRDGNCAEHLPADDHLPR